MIGVFDPASYPGPRPPGPVLVHRGVAHRLVVDGPAEAPLRLAAPDEAQRARSASVLTDPLDVRWSLAYGSNASPARLVSKELDRDGAILLPARAVDVVPAFEHRRTGYGAVPLTLLPAPGSVIDTWVLGLPSHGTDRLDRTEGRVPEGASPTSVPEPDDERFAPSGTYQLARVGEVGVADRFLLSEGLAYLPGPATRCQITAEGAWRTWPTCGQRGAAAHLDAGGADRAVPTVETPVPGGWPATPLTDLPLFVYGTLGPGGSAWETIADLVHELEPATAVGTLHDTGRGWPAATFAAGGSRPGVVRGTLLAARGSAEAQALFAGADACEGVPELFVRRTVRVTAGSGSRWAVSYAWAGDRPPGQPLAHGEWVVR